MFECKLKDKVYMHKHINFDYITWFTSGIESRRYLEWNGESRRQENFCSQERIERGKHDCRVAGIDGCRGPYALHRSIFLNSLEKVFSVVCQLFDQSNESGPVWWISSILHHVFRWRANAIFHSIRYNVVATARRLRIRSQLGFSVIVDWYPASS